MSTQNNCFGWVLRKLIFNFALLSGGPFKLMDKEIKCQTGPMDSLIRLSILKETKSATMNIFRFFFYFIFKSFVKVELSYVFTINLFTIAENCTEK